MKVLKFGGTSVGTVESLLNVKKIVESIPGNAVIVVSALGGLTDKMIATAGLAAKGDGNWKEEMNGIRQRHFNIIEHVVPEPLKKEVIIKVSRQLDGLERNFEGVFLLRNLSEQILNTIVSFGERISSVIVAAMVQNGKRYFSPDFVKTEKRYGKNVADAKLTDKLIKETFTNLEAEEKAIVPGFISTDVTTGEITNLGRGGSDYTAALIAAALDAEILEIWTDVDGFMTADPRVVKEAIIIDHLTFTESMELCTFGAKVIYPPTIYPVFHKNIPIKILNTFNPEAPGTLITEQSLKEDLDVKGVTFLKGISLLTLKSNSLNKDRDIMNRAYRVLSRQAIRIIPVANSDLKNELKFAIASPDIKMSLQMIGKEFEPEIVKGIIEPPYLKEGLVAMAVVGKEMKEKSGLKDRIRHSLHRNGIIVEAHCAGTSHTTLIYIIEEGKSQAALPLIHSLIYM